VRHDAGLTAEKRDRAVDEFIELVAAHVGLEVGCPSNVTDNTAVDNGASPAGALNLELIGHGCNNTNNVAP
jgi:hypothetical protein